MPLKAFLDDSGTHTNDSPVCVAAGYFGQEYQWKQFDSEWQRVLKGKNSADEHSGSSLERYCRAVDKIGVQNAWPRQKDKEVLAQ